MAEPIRPEVVVVVGRSIRARRSEAGLSVQALADRSDVSRRMLTQIELGQANPSLATLDKIASALGTTFPALLEVTTGDSPHGVEVWSTPAGSWAYLLTATEAPGFFVEMWRWRLVGDDVYRLEPSASNLGSMIHVVRGRLSVRGATAEEITAEGASWSSAVGVEATFAADTELVEFVRVVTLKR